MMYRGVCFFIWDNTVVAIDNITGVEDLLFSVLMVVWRGMLVLPLTPNDPQSELVTLLFEGDKISTYNYLDVAAVS